MRAERPPCSLLRHLFVSSDGPGAAAPYVNPGTILPHNSGNVRSRFVVQRHPNRRRKLPVISPRPAADSVPIFIGQERRCQSGFAGEWTDPFQLLCDAPPQLRAANVVVTSVATSRG